MDELKITIQNLDTNLEVENVDIHCIEKIELNYVAEEYQEIVASSIVDIEDKNGTIRIKFEWKAGKEELQKDNFLFIPETQVLFFRTVNQWGAVNLKNKRLKRQEAAICFPYISKQKYCVLIEDELNAESVNFEGDKIDSVPIDPPVERKDFDDKIEYNSPVYGFQILKIK